MSDYKIEKVKKEQFKKLTQLSKITFKEAFAKDNTEENMNSYLTQEFNNEKTKQELNNPESTFYFIKQNQEIIGYLKINVGKAQTELQENKALEIERIYILKEFQGKKAGQFLLNETIKKAQKIKADYIWLGVWEHNPRAIGFYKKNGFIPFNKHQFKLGNDIQTDIMMKLPL